MNLMNPWGAMPVWQILVELVKEVFRGQVLHRRARPNQP